MEHSGQPLDVLGQIYQKLKCPNYQRFTTLWVSVENFASMVLSRIIIISNPTKTDTFSPKAWHTRTTKGYFIGSDLKWVLSRELLKERDIFWQLYRIYSGVFERIVQIIWMYWSASDSIQNKMYPM